MASYWGGGGAHVLQFCLQGVSRGGHREFRFSFSFFFCPHLCWKETLQKSSHITPVQKDMSWWILSEVVFWLSVGQRGSCTTKKRKEKSDTSLNAGGVFLFHRVVKACSSMNEKSKINGCKQQVLHCVKLSSQRDPFAAIAAHRKAKKKVTPLITWSHFY